MGYASKLNAYQQHAIFDRPTNSTVLIKGSKSLVLKTTGYENLRKIMVSVLTDRRKLTPFIIIKRKNLPSGIIFKCNEKD
jgi:hypothetical protein